MSACVYTFADKAGEPLYIGSSGNLMRRVQQHAYERGWWLEVASIEVEHHLSISDARFAEHTAIVENRPKYNRHHNRRPHLSDLEPAA